MAHSQSHTTINVQLCESHSGNCHSMSDTISQGTQRKLAIAVYSVSRQLYGRWTHPLTMLFDRREGFGLPGFCSPPLLVLPG